MHTHFPKKNFFSTSIHAFEAVVFFLGWVFFIFHPTNIQKYRKSFLFTHFRTSYLSFFYYIFWLLVHCFKKFLRNFIKWSVLFNIFAIGISHLLFSGQSGLFTNCLEIFNSLWNLIYKSNEDLYITSVTIAPMLSFYFH